MVNFIAGAVMMFFLIVVLCALRVGGDADDRWNEIMRDHEEEK